MSVIYGTFVDGTVVFANPPNWPNGTPLRIEVADPTPVVGLREEDWPTDPDGVAALVARIAALEPVMTPEEDAAWRAELARRKAEELFR